MDDGLGWLIGIFILIIAVVAIVYIITLIAAVLAGVAAAGGSLWGGGSALINYGKSFKENMIDSNRATA